MVAEVSSVSGQTVCVTGAAGFVASWLVKLLLEKGYIVKGTVRNPDEAKISHLKELQGANERLIICKADVLDYESICNAIRGCDGVFHTAFPVVNNSEIVMDIALKGTKNVMNAAAEARVRRVVYTSTMGTVHMDPNRSPDKVLDETCWSDLKYLKSIQDWYSYAKVLDEQTAWSVASERGMDLVTVIPPAVVGAMLQPTVNASISHVRKFLNGTNKMYSNAVLGYVHARDLALAHILVYETPSAFGRYLCIESVAHRREIAEMLIKMFPEYPIPTKCSDNIKPTVKAYKFTNQRLKDLGMKFTPLRQGLYDSVKSLQEKGHLSVPSMSKNSHHIHGHQSNVSKLAPVLNNAARSRL